MPTGDVEAESGEKWLEPMFCAERGIDDGGGIMPEFADAEGVGGREGAFPSPVSRLLFIMPSTETSSGRSRFRFACAAPLSTGVLGVLRLADGVGVDEDICCFRAMSLANMDGRPA